MWDELAEDDLEFQSEFIKLFDKPDVKEADKELPPDLYYNYFSVELTSDRGGNRSEFSRVKKRLKNANGRSIGMANDNLILDSIMYEVK